MNFVILIAIATVILVSISTYAAEAGGGRPNCQRTLAKTRPRDSVVVLHELKAKRQAAPESEDELLNGPDPDEELDERIDYQNEYAEDERIDSVE